MLARTHNLVAFATMLIVVQKLQPSNLGITTVSLALVGNTIGSLLPDIDQASNKLWDLIPGGDLMGKYLKIFFGPHRTISHSIIGALMFGKFIHWILPNVLNQQTINIEFVELAIIVGYISHLLADGLTEEGLPLLFPIKWKTGIPPIRSWRIKTGKWFENLVIFPGVLVFILWSLFLNHELFWKVVFGV